MSVHLFLCLLCVIVSTSAANLRIVNGQDSNYAEFPFMVSLRSEFGQHLCGGTFIARQWILTAAHCVISYQSRILNVQYGVTDISAFGPFIAQIKKMIIHEEYEPKNSFRNDIALIELVFPVYFSATVQAIRLPRRKLEISFDTRVTIAGWGYGETKVVQNHLQKVDVFTYSNENCARIYNHTTIFSTQLCAGVAEGGKGQCTGDSGGPLFLDGIQLGIISWSTKPCARAPYPGVYTKVSHYIDWIKNNTKF